MDVELKLASLVEEKKLNAMIPQKRKNAMEKNSFIYESILNDN